MVDINIYQQEAWKFAKYPNKGNNIFYPTLGLVGESGEIANKVKKIIRDDNGELTDDARIAIMSELSDVAWYLAAMATELGFDLDTILQHNLLKLQSRQQRNVIGGSGDNR